MKAGKRDPRAAHAAGNMALITSTATEVIARAQVAGAEYEIQHERFYSALLLLEEAANRTWGSDNRPAGWVTPPPPFGRA